jgi:hypothetical protein
MEFYEFFDSYTNGSSMHGQGGWKGWQNDPTWTAYVTDEQSFSVPHAVNITGDADLVHEFDGVDAGVWEFSAMQLVPDTYAGQSYFILLNTYDDGGTFNWSQQVRFDADLGVVESEADGAQLPLITGQWVELKTVIDFDNDLQTIYYDSQMLVQKSWTDGLSGGGALSLGAVDLFANGASPIYYDNISLVPEPAVLCGIALGFVLSRKRR